MPPEDSIEAVEPETVVEAPVENPADFAEAETETTTEQTPQEAAEAAALNPESEYVITLNGQAERLSGAQYSYLAEAGARALLAAKGGDEEAPETPAEPAEPEPTDPITLMQKEIEGLKSEMQKGHVNAEQVRLEREVNESMASSEIFKLAKAFDNGDKILGEVKQDIYTLALRKNIGVPAAIKEVENRYAAFMGSQQKTYLEGKLKEMQGAVEGAGGKTRSPEKPATRKNWQNDELWLRTKAMLESK